MVRAVPWSLGAHGTTYGTAARHFKHGLGVGVAYSVDTPSVSNSATASELSTGIGFSSVPLRVVG